jgi:hypothetical protein
MAVCLVAFIGSDCDSRPGYEESKKSAAMLACDRASFALRNSVRQIEQVRFSPRKRACDWTSFY